MAYEYDERVLNDDNPVFTGYWYLADGESFQSPVSGTVLDLRRAFPSIKTFQYCDITKRGLEPL